MNSLAKVYISPFPRHKPRFATCLMTPSLTDGPVGGGTIVRRYSEVPYFKEELNV